MRLELTRRGDYAVRAMLALSAPNVDPWLSASRISGAMAIPERFLPRVLRDLARAGLVEARTGRTGGYRLARASRAITLFDVIAAVEPEDGARRCILRGIPCATDGRCAVHEPFDQARTAMQGRLAATTLADLAQTTA
jgi:Rrf2 family transcriptional regulator, iron-sulfur cluster assembly transcription factor